ncbi:Type IV pilus biogenesis protein PilO [hydrothermal vent metagenome]|uniref:Type IV pilus biogenesis protein PilO n=1 Tax=hydrothermal vent metagenome TaxID=652676 RepID=A0A3B0ZED5_9ZZZZ
MDLADLNELDLSNIANWPLPARAFVITLVFVGVLGAGYWLDIKDQRAQLEKSERKEVELRRTFENRAQKAANLEAYEQQLAEMRESFGAMLRQLPDRTEVAELLVDISQTGLAAGLEFELFKPQAEVPREFYAELPISIRVKGNYHEFGEFVSGVAALPRIVTVHDVNIKDNQEGLLTMDILAKTYRYMDEEGGDQ